MASLKEKIHHLDDMLKSQQRKVRHMIEQVSVLMVHTHTHTMLMMSTLLRNTQDAFEVQMTSVGTGHMSVLI